MTDPTDLTVQVATLADALLGGVANPDNVGLRPAWTSVGAGEVTNGVMFEDTGQNQFEVIKTSAGETIVTASSNPCDQGYTTEHNLIAHMQAGDSTPTELRLGPWPASRWAATVGSATNRVTVKFSGVTTGLKVRVVRVPVVGA